MCLLGAEVCAVKQLSGLRPIHRGMELISAQTLHGKPALVLSDVGPQDLAQWLIGSRLDVAQFLEFAVQMAEIASGLHSHNIIHRDLCPANFVLDERGRRITLVDFELSTGLLGPAELPSGPGTAAMRAPCSPSSRCIPPSSAAHRDMQLAKHIETIDSHAGSKARR